MKMYVYHYCAIYQPRPGMTAYFDGVIRLGCKIDSAENYRELRIGIAKDNFQPEKLTITSLSFLHEVEE